MHLRIPLLTLLLLSACQPPVKDEPDAGKKLADAGVDAGISRCGPYAHEEGDDCVSELEWFLQPPGPSARDHHGTYIYANDNAAALVVVNGIDMHHSEPKFDAWYAHLDADGFIDEWHVAPRPLFWSGGAGVDGYGDRAYFVSGAAGGSNTPRVQSLQFNADGTPGAWREETTLSGAGRFHITATRVGRWLFALGGRLSDGKAMPEIWSAHIEDDGTLSAWSDARPFPAPRTHHASFAVGNRLYVTGGFDAQTFTDDPVHYRDVLVAEVDQDTGALSEWTSLPLPWDLSTHSATYFEGSVYLFGGFNGALNLLAKVRRAKVNDDGTLGEFEELEPLPEARAHVHHTPVHNGRFYSVGGNIGGHVPHDKVLLGILY